MYLYLWPLDYSMGMGLACLIVVSGNYALIKELLTKIGGAKDASEVPRSRQDTVIVKKALFALNEQMNS